MTWHGARMSSEIYSDRFIAPIHQFKVTQHIIQFIHTVFVLSCFLVQLVVFCTHTHTCVHTSVTIKPNMIHLQSTHIHTHRAFVLFNIVINKFQIFNTKNVLDFTLHWRRSVCVLLARMWPFTVNLNDTLQYFWFQPKWALFDFFPFNGMCMYLCFASSIKLNKWLVYITQATTTTTTTKTDQR